MTGALIARLKSLGQVDLLFAEMLRRNPARQAALVAAETYEVLGHRRTAARWRSGAGPR